MAPPNSRTYLLNRRRRKGKTISKIISAGFEPAIDRNPRTWRAKAQLLEAENVELYDHVKRLSRLVRLPGHERSQDDFDYNDGYGGGSDDDYLMGNSGSSVRESIDILKGRDTAARAIRHRTNLQNRQRRRENWADVSPTFVDAFLNGEVRHLADCSPSLKGRWIWFLDSQSKLHLII
jgi:hypothetical protein